MGRSWKIATILGLLVAASPVGARALPPAPVPGPECGTSSTAATASPRDDGTLTVATFNVLHGLSEQPTYPAHSTLDVRLAMSAVQLLAGGADIVGMQEVSRTQPTDPNNKTLSETIADEEPFGILADTAPTKHLTRDVASALAQALDLAAGGERWYWCWYLANPRNDAETVDLQPGGGGPISDLSAEIASAFVSPQYRSFKEGLAIVSRYPIIRAAGRALPPRLAAEIPLCMATFFEDPEAAITGCALPAGFERRSVLWAAVDSPAGRIDVTTTHLAHGITAASDASGLQQVAIALAFSEAMSEALSATGGDPVAGRFFTCDCNAQPGEDVPVVSFIEQAGWRNTLPGGCDTANVCTAGPDVIVTDAPARAMDARLDYVFARAGTCTRGSRLIVNTPIPWDGPDEDTALDDFLWPSDHIGVASNLTSC